MGMGEANIEREKIGIKFSIIFFLVLLFISLLKILVGKIYNTPVLVADGLHSITDSLEIAAIAIGLYISSKKFEEKFPYGLYKVENFVTLLVSLLIIKTSFDLLADGISICFGRIKQLTTVFHIPIVVSLFSALISFVLSYLGKNLGKKYRIDSIIAVSEEYTIDSLVSIIVAISIIISKITVIFQGIIIIILSILLLRISIGFLHESFLALLDVSPPKEKIEKILKIIKKHNLNVGKYRLRVSGPYIFGEIEILLNKPIQIGEFSEMCEKLRKDIRKAVPEVLHIVFIPIIRKEEIIVCIPAEKINNKYKVANTFSLAPYLYFFRIKNGKIIKEWVEENPYIKKEIRRGAALAEYLCHKKRIDVLIVKNIGDISYHFLKSHFVEIYKAKYDDIYKNIEEFINNKLEKIEAPTKRRI